jgi:hypothetical protein
MFTLDKKVPTTEMERQQQQESLIDFKIEKNIPVPRLNGVGRSRTNHSIKAISTLYKMEVGDSFVITRTTCTQNQVKVIVKAMTREIKERNLPYSIKTRIQKNDNKEFISARVWLIG